MQAYSNISKLTESVINCSFRVYNALGFGFLESVYEKSLLIELRNAQIPAEAQSSIKVFYRDESVGDFFADILIGNFLIIELKSVARLTQAHEVQLVNYLKATGIENGLLLNFGPQRVDLKRKFKTYKTP